MKKGLVFLASVCVLAFSIAALSDTKPYYNKWYDTYYDPYYVIAYEDDIFEIDDDCSGSGICARWGTYEAGYLEDAINTYFKTPGSTSELYSWQTEYYDIEQEVWREYDGTTAGVDIQSTGISGTFRWYRMYESSDITDWNRGHESGYQNELSALRWLQGSGGWYLLFAVELWEVDSDI
jgi:hypothetical protein